MGLDFLLPKFHFFAFTGFSLLGPAGAVAMRAALGHAAVKGGRGMVNMPPVPLTAHVAAVIGHGLQIKTGAQALGGNRLGDRAAVPLVKDAVARHIRRLLPKAAQAFEIAEKVVQVLVLNFSSTIIYDNVVRGA